MKPSIFKLMLFAFLFQPAHASDGPTVQRDRDAFSFAAITVPDIASSAEWYEKHFGLARGFSYVADDKSVQILVLSGPGLTIELQQHSDALPLQAPAGKSFLRHGIFKFGARVADVKGAVKGLEAAGVSVKVAPFEDQNGGFISAVISDNSGNLIQLFQTVEKRTE